MRLFMQLMQGNVLHSASFMTLAAVYVKTVYLTVHPPGNIFASPVPDIQRSMIGLTGGICADPLHETCLAGLSLSL